MSFDKTLTDEDIESEVKNIVKEVIHKTGAVLRAV
jgi:phenylalanyl-tRNA synthetase beta subunit